MDRIDKIELVNNSKGMFIILEKRIRDNKTITISGKIENVDKDKGEILLRNLANNSIRVISIDSFDEFNIEPINNSSSPDTSKVGGDSNVWTGTIKALWK